MFLALNLVLNRRSRMHSSRMLVALRACVCVHVRADTHTCCTPCAWICMQRTHSVENKFYRESADTQTLRLDLHAKAEAGAAPELFNENLASDTNSQKLRALVHLLHESQYREYFREFVPKRAARLSRGPSPRPAPAKRCSCMS